MVQGGYVHLTKLVVILVAGLRMFLMKHLFIDGYTMRAYL